MPPAPLRPLVTPESLGPLVRAVAGANVTLVALFAIFHDARRRSDSHDTGHGERGAQGAVDLRAAERSLARFEPEFVAGWWGEGDVSRAAR